MCKHVLKVYDFALSLVIVCSTIIGGLLIGIAVARADKPKFPQVGPQTSPQYQKMHDPKYWAGLKKGFDALANHAWLSESWTGNDAPFAQLRETEERQVTMASPLSDFVAGYATNAQSHPNDPVALFGWGYAVHLATINQDYKVDDESDLLTSINFALAEVPSPHTYDYDRLRYMMRIEWIGPWGGHILLGMGERLLQKNPTDFPIQVDQADIYTCSNHYNCSDPKAALQHGYKLIQSLIKQYPTKGSVYDALANWYDVEMIFVKHDRADYENALVNWQKAYALYPATSARRAALPGVIQWLNQQYARVRG